MTTPYLAASTNITVGEHSQWHLFGLTLNSDTIISTVVASVILLILGFIVRAKVTSGPPNGLQLFFETVTKFLRDQIETTVGVKVAPFLIPLSLVLFSFLLICNWLSVLPLTFNGKELLPPPAGDVNLVYPLALLVFFWKHVAGSRVHHGPGHQLAHTLKGHLPAFAPMWVIEEISGVVSHSLRLFGNILAGGIMLEVIATLLPPEISWVLNGGWKLFDLFIGAIQAFIFAFLTIIYFSQAMEIREDH
ncbi:MAG TPA: FoF1 ATP synthase subunit a [Pseudonocardiaceae bacterium]|jgi:F-type H+-transporting ATPase subunit a|nr:FoF1 ATP synthase subunit a [Pseudonocardiaceae bacterium]